MTMIPDKIAIEFLTTAGNYFIVKEEGGYVTLDPNGDFAPELLKRYNNYPALESQVKELREANVELLDSLKETLFRFRSLHDKLTFKQKAQSIDFDKWPVVVRAKSVIDKAQLLNKQP